MRNVLVLSVIVQVLISSIIGYASQRSQKIHAIRANEPIKLDGILSEKVWQGSGYSGFIQEQPEEGKPASEKTVVRIAYDDKALYISARLYDSEPGKIIGLLGRRDNFVDSDWFVFSVDPYFDRRSGYQFAVNPAGTIVDWTIHNDENRDSTWDGIWESRTRIDEHGWTVEMKIPFEQLRFKKKDRYVWGVNFKRYIKRKNEQSGIVFISRNSSGYVSHFARLEGIKDISPGHYVELVPYSTGRASFGAQEEGNPFETGKEFVSNAGLDMKIPLKSNLMLDLTVNPDFGQVEADPANMNLSAAESYYSEKRLFFIEGSNIFRFGRGGSNRNINSNFGSPSFFYSRRIGRAPQGSVDTDGYIRYPEFATILGAAKITGKVTGGWNIGFLTALTKPQYADIDLDGQRYQEAVEPLTYYGVLRAQKELNNGLQGLGFITTAVIRDIPTEMLAETLNDEAYSFAMDGWTFLDGNKAWVVNGWFGGTHVTGSKEKILDLQQSYPHYYQRPDVSHVRLNPEATSMDGWAGRLAINKQEGNFMFNAAVGAISPGFDSRDIGFQWNGDIINGHIMVGYRTFKPGNLFRRWSVQLFSQRNYDFSGNKIGEQRLILIGNAQFLNYWSLYSQVSYNPPRWSKDLTRGGPLTYHPTNTWGQIAVHSDNRQSLVFESSHFFNYSTSGTRVLAISGGFRWKPANNFSVSVFPRYEDEKEMAQYVTQLEDEYMADTYGNRYIFGTLKQKTLVCNIRFNWVFSPQLSLQTFIQPYIAVGDYCGFKELAFPRSYSFNVFGESSSTIGYDDDSMIYTVDPDGTGIAPAFEFDNPDFNYKSLRGTVVLRWEYKPGSTIYAVWAQNRSDESHPGDFRLGRDFSDLLKASGDDIFMIKFMYRFKI